MLKKWLSASATLTLTLPLLSTFATNASGNDEVFVRWRDGVNEQKRSEIVNKSGLKLVWRSELVADLERYEVASASQAIASLNGNSSLQYIEPNYKIHRHLQDMQPLDVSSLPMSEGDPVVAAPNDPLFNQQWAHSGVAGMHVQDAWKVTRGSQDVKVAVIDTGVDATHEELSDRVLAGFDFIDNTAVVTDHHGHGTHVSGIIGARTDNGKGIAGVSPNVSIVPIRAVPSEGDETDANVISAFEFAAKSGARVANCSFGKPEASRAVADAIEAAGRAGVLAVVAAGNDGQDNNTHGDFPANFHTANMIVVASIASTGRLSGFSNFGLNLVDVAAPGSGILSSIPGNNYASWSGTSMATPQVVGVAALVMAVNPKLDIYQVRDVILNSAVKSDLLAGRITTGARVDALSAVNAAHNLLSSAILP